MSVLPDMNKEAEKMTLESSELSQAPFGELLKSYRKRGKLTQRQLAARLDVHYNTVWAWERGDHLPDTRGLVFELARQLHLNDQETRQLLEASLTALSPYWHLPYLRNPFFTGREQVLDQLHDRLCSHQTVELTQSYALHGLGGIGKTQLAVEYAYRYALSYTAVFWIGAESGENIVTGFLAIAELLNLPERKEADQQRIVAAVKHWLIAHKEWLLIWDNVEDPDILQRFLPPARQGAMLITTRRQALGILAKGIELQTMEPAESMLLLLRRAKALDLEATEAQIEQLAMSRPEEYTAARELVTVMGGLPLALDQAGAYIEETGCSLADYLERYEQQRTQLLDRRGTAGGDHPHSVTATFLLSSKRVEREHPIAADILRICALVYAETIPEELIAKGTLHPGAQRDGVAADAYHIDLAIAALRNFSLLQRHVQTRTLSIHRLVQAVLLDALSLEERREWTERLIRILNAAFPEVEYTTWNTCERLLPHVLACVQNTGSWNIADLELATLLQKAAKYLNERALYEDAERLFQRALRIREQMLGPDHLEVATSLNDLAVLYKGQGRYTEAEQLCLRVLSIREQALGADHPEVALCFNNLAVLYYEQGRYTEAEPLCQAALRIREQVLGPEHPLVASSLNNLTVVYFEQGRYTEAEAPCLRSLRIREQMLGPDHPSVALSLANLASIHYKQSRCREAELGWERTMRIWERALGPDHPLIAEPLNGLASLYRDQERYAEAAPLFQRALTLREQHLGPQHPETAETLHNLALFYEKQGDGGTALALYRRALAIRSQRLGDSHPKTIATRTRYVQLLGESGYDSD